MRAYELQDGVLIDGVGAMERGSFQITVGRTSPRQGARNGDYGHRKEVVSCLREEPPSLENGRAHWVALSSRGVDRRINHFCREDETQWFMRQAQPSREVGDILVHISYPKTGSSGYAIVEGDQCEGVACGYWPTTEHHSIHEYVVILARSASVRITLPTGVVVRLDNDNGAAALRSA